MKLLAIETSSDRGTVAVQSGEDILTEEIAGVREQSVRIVPVIDALLGRAALSLTELDAIVFGRGPGSFTGVRLAASVAQGLAMAADLKVVPVSSLAALAQQVERRERVERALICVDARMGEVYWGEYVVSNGTAVVVGREMLSAPRAVIFPSVQDWAAVGSGFSRYSEDLEAGASRAALLCADWLAAAIDLLPLARLALNRGEAVAAERIAPSYLRGQEAWETRD